ncbi:MAG: hypothetical protein IKJ92_02845 [Bacteroidaceae bacterium]|nr:hypothetical protein [Bacteroidaceae bacterium]
MRKFFTLFFMSMFLMSGTVVAQDTAFGLKAVTPSSDKPTTRVDNVTLVFTKDVTATMPEGGIEVINDETKESVKLASIYENPYMDKNIVLFEFEKKVLPGKDGKDEEQSLYIDTPGNYSFTIPAGCIKSVDGEEFAEQTFTFSVVGTFSLVSYSPTTTDKLEKIDITFEKEIINVAMPNSGMMVADLYWSSFVNIKKDVTISEDKKTVTLELESPITTPGQYFMDLYNGVFISAEGINENASLVFNVVDSNPSFSFNYEDGSKVQELGNLEITFSNVKEVKLIENGPKVTAYLPGGSDIEGTAALADNKITVTFDQQFTEEGEYVFQVPAGMFTMDGVANEERLLTLTLYTFTITPLEVVSVTPAAGTVDQLDRIVVKYNQKVSLSMDENWQQISREIKLTCNGETYTLTYNSMRWEVTDEIEYLVNAEWVENDYKTTPITAAGEYSLNLADIVVDHAAEEGIDEWGYPATIWHSKKQSCAGTCVWTVTGGSNVEKIEVATGEQVIYDLLGRRVEKIAGAGIYIVNGKKMIVK